MLIFSQMKLVLNLLEQYMEAKGYEYERIDGNIRGNERQAAIDRFCKPGSSVFVFLLSTRAGGLGINLAAADTVIIFDSDWNPQNDMQAQARAHRLGQTQNVKVYRLITSRTYEMEMFQRASKKLGLDQAVLRSMPDSGEGGMGGVAGGGVLSVIDKKEVESLLKYGAYDLFNEAADAASRQFCEDDIDLILQQRTTVVTQQTEGDDETEGDETSDGGSAQRRRRQGTSTFSKANFTSASSDSAVDLHASDFWEQIIPDQRTATKLAQRLASNEGLLTLTDRTTFLDDLFLLVQEVIASHQQGTVPPNTSEVMTVLANVSEKGGDGGFSDEQRAQAVEWMQEIERPRRQRRQLERWSDISSQAFIDAAANGGLDGSDLTGEWRSGDRNERGGESLKRRKMQQAQSAARQFTRKERRVMITAVITYSGLCPSGSGSSPSLHSLAPPIPSAWQAIHVASGLTDRPFEQFAGFCLAFLAYCSTRSDEEDSMVFQWARARLIDALPSAVVNAVVEEVLDDALEKEQNGELKDDIVVEGAERTDDLILISPPGSSTSSAIAADLTPLSPTVELPPPAVMRSHSSIPASSSSPPPPPTVRAASTLPITERYPRHNRNPSSRAITPLPTAAVDPRSVEYTSIPCMVNDKLFHKHVVKRVKKWARHISLAQGVQSELDRYVVERREREEKGDKVGMEDEKVGEGVKVESGDEESSDDEDEDDEASEDSDSPVDDALLAQRNAMTARSRGRKWKRESIKVQQRRVREEFKRRKAADQRLARSSALLTALQQRYGSYYALSVPSKVDRQPVWWWAAEDDKRLLVGVSKHGMDFRAIEEDEQLGFAQRLNEEPMTQLKEDGSEKAVLELSVLVDPFVNIATLDDKGALVSPSLAAVNADGESQSVSCICSREPKAVKSAATKQCARCHHMFHIDCLDKARLDSTLRPEQFPPMPMQQQTSTRDGEAEDEQNGVMHDRRDAEDEEVAEVKEPRRAASKASVSKARASKKRVPDEDGEEDDENALDDTMEDEQDEDEDELSASRSRAHSASPNSWLCDRCEMEFPADRALEFRLRSLIEAFDRDRHAIARLTKRRVVDKSARPIVPRKGEESNTAWTRKDRLRVQRGVQLFGCTDAGIALMRRKMELTGKSESSLRAYCERLVAQCQLIVAQSRREQDEQSFQTTADELKTRGEELHVLTERVNRIAAKESEVQRRREDRKARQLKADGSSESSSEAEDTSMYCTCEGKVDDRFMVSCDAQEEGCREWYHGKCVGIRHDQELPAVWVCANCKAKQATRAKREDEQQTQTSAPSTHLRLLPPSPMSNVPDRPPTSNTSRVTHSTQPSTATTPTVAVPSAFSANAPAVVPLAAPAQPMYEQSGMGYQPPSFSFHMQQQQQQQQPQQFTSFHPQYGQHQQQLEQAFVQHQQQQQQQSHQVAYGGFVQQSPGMYLSGYGDIAVPYGHPQQFSVLQPSPYFSSQFSQPQYDGYGYSGGVYSQAQHNRMLLFNLQQQQNHNMAVLQHWEKRLRAAAAAAPGLVPYVASFTRQSAAGIVCPRWPTERFGGACGASRHPVFTSVAFASASCGTRTADRTTERTASLATAYHSSSCRAFISLLVPHPAAAFVAFFRFHSSF